MQETLHELPGVLKQANNGFGKLATRDPRDRPHAARARAVRHDARADTEAVAGILQGDRADPRAPGAPAAPSDPAGVRAAQPSLKDFSQSTPATDDGFTVINEFLNELAYNPGPNQGDFLFYLDWANHDLNSTVAQGDAHGAVGQALLYFNCAQLYPVNS